MQYAYAYPNVDEIHDCISHRAISLDHVLIECLARKGATMVLLSEKIVCIRGCIPGTRYSCLLYTSDAADE